MHHPLRDRCSRAFIALILVSAFGAALPASAEIFKCVAKDGTVPPCIDDPGIYTAVRSGDFLADAKIAWRDAYEMQMRAAVRPLAQAAE